MLSEICSEENLSKILSLTEKFRPFPLLEDRKSWEGLHSEVKGLYLEEAERYSDFEWKPLTAVGYLDFARTGNRSRYETVYFEKRNVLATLLIAECIEAKGRFIDQVINGIWSICEESSWVIPAHNNHYGDGTFNALHDIESKYIFIDLFSAETASLLAWVYYFLNEKLNEISPLITKRIRYELNKRIIAPYLELNDYGWMGFTPGAHRVNNWNPWINSNCLTVFSIIEEDSTKKIKALNKCVRSLDKFIGLYHEDGGCDEGPSYCKAAGASMFDCLEILYEFSHGTINVYGNELVKNIGRYIYRMNISDNYYVNFADGSTKINMPGELIYRFGCRIGDEKLSDFGIQVFMQNTEVGMIEKSAFFMHRAILNLFNYENMLNKKYSGLHEKTVWLDGIQVMVSRELEEKEGLFLAIKGGTNDESHNHNDVGHFVIYSDGKPAIVDLGVETYSAKTFSQNRYDIWTMQSQYHNLPRVNGCDQQDGKEYYASDVAFTSDGNRDELCMDISTAYPAKANIKRWKRKANFNRTPEASIQITDDFTLKSLTCDLTMNLITPCAHDISKSGQVIFAVQGGRDIKLEYDAFMLSVESTRVEIKDEKLIGEWGSHIFRLQFTCKNEVKEELHNMVFTQVG